MKFTNSCISIKAVLSVRKHLTQQSPELRFVPQSIIILAFLNQSVPLVTVRSNFSLLMEQLWFQCLFPMSKIDQSLPFFFIEEYKIKRTTLIMYTFCFLSFLKDFITKIGPKFQTLILISNRVLMRKLLKILKWYLISMYW